MDKARIRQLEARKKACAQKVKHIILQSVRSERTLTDAENALVDQLHVEGSAIDAKLERAFYAPDDPSA